ncbi:MAG: hypothetical protein HY921_11555 [Elusimicrobia bacterium]|nr:hypothetical protein [Elusimicrobiota bacterium]
MNPLLSAGLRILLTAAGLAVAFLPRSWEVRLGRFLGRTLLALDYRRRPIAEENIRRCLTELGRAERERLLAKNYEHYGILGLELLHMFCPLPGHYRRYTEKNTVLEGFENFERAQAKKRGCLLITAHLANWEIMGIAAVRGIPATMVTRRLKPEWLNRKIEAARLSIEVKTLSQRGFLPTLIKRLRQGLTVGFVMDQYAAPPMGVPVKFFKAVTDTLAAPAILAQRTGACLISVVQWRDEAGLVHVEVGPEIELGEALKDPVQATQALVARVEGWIRRHPDQWLWAHRRFKNATWHA